MGTRNNAKRERNSLLLNRPILFRTLGVILNVYGENYARKGFEFMIILGDNP